MLDLSNPQWKCCNYCDHFEINQYSDSPSCWAGSSPIGVSGRCNAMPYRQHVNGFGIRWCGYYKESIHNWYNIPKDEYWLTFVTMQLRQDLREEIEFKVERFSEDGRMDNMNYDLGVSEKTSIQQNPENNKIPSIVMIDVTTKNIPSKDE